MFYRHGFSYSLPLLFPFSRCTREKPWKRVHSLRLGQLSGESAVHCCNFDRTVSTFQPRSEHPSNLHKHVDHHAYHPRTSPSPPFTPTLTMFLLLPVLLSVSMVWAAPYCSLAPVAQSGSTATSAGGSGSHSSNGTGSGSSSSPGSVVAATWWASWHNSDFPLSSISWSKYSSVIYAFG